MLLPIVTLFLTTVGTMIAQPVNDSFGKASLITGVPATGSNVGATRQPNDPANVDQPGSSRSSLGGHSVWWKWVAPSSGLYNVKTGDRSGREPNSDFDTQLGIYTGATLGTLVEVASNEDNAFYPNGLSSVEINAIEGQTYHILVDGYGGATGTIYLYVVPTRFTLTVSANPPEAGHVNFEPAFDPSGYEAGTVVTLQASPTTDANFYGWSGSVAGRTNPITFVMDGNKAIVANFFNPPEIDSGDDQLVLRHTDGRIAGWNFSGTDFLNASALGTVSSDWRLAAVQDLNANSSGDFLFQHRDGRVTAWFMENNVRTGKVTFATVPTTLRLVGAGDLNYDTQPDFIFQHTGGIVVRPGNGSALGQIKPLGNINSSWRAVTVADFNNDGSADIFFQHQDGRLAAWLMNGTFRNGTVALGTTPWRLAAVRDLNGDANVDLIFQKQGRTAVWLMEGSTRSSALLLRNGTVISEAWKIVGAR